MLALFGFKFPFREVILFAGVTGLLEPPGERFCLEFITPLPPCPWSWF